MAIVRHSAIPHFKKTSAPRIPHYDKAFIIKVQSNFVKNDEQFILGPNPRVDQIYPSPDQNFTDIVVIHPGSRNLKVGFASDAIPKEIPHVIARKVNLDAAEFVEDELQEGQIIPKIHGTSSVTGCNVELDPKNDQMAFISEEIKARIRHQHIRILPQSKHQSKAFNEQSQPEVIAEHNDHKKVDSTEVGPNDTYFIGRDAIRLAQLNDPASDWRIFYPLQFGFFNVQDYKSVEHCMSDIALIWEYALENVLHLKKEEWSKYYVALVISDSFNRKQVRLLLDMLLNTMDFKACLLVQEGLGTSFGAGMASSCVVDIGATCTTVSCVEDGYLNPESRRSLKYGGDDVSVYMMHLFSERSFPYKGYNLVNRMYDWLMVEDLKFRILTMTESNLTTKVHEFFVRAPKKPVVMYKVKIFDEAIKAGWILFYPGAINFESKLKDYLLKETFLDYGGVTFAETNALTKEERKANVKEYLTYIHPSKSTKENGTESNFEEDELDDDDDEDLSSLNESDIFDFDDNEEMKHGENSSMTTTSDRVTDNIDDDEDLEDDEESSRQNKRAKLEIFTDDENDAEIVDDVDENDISDPEEAVKKAITGGSTAGTPRTDMVPSSSTGTNMSDSKDTQDTRNDKEEDNEEDLTITSGERKLKVPLNSFILRRRGLGTVHEAGQSLDAAIVDSIITCIDMPNEGRDNKALEQRVRKLCSSIIVVGGGSRISGLNKVIEDKVYLALMRNAHVIEVLKADGIQQIASCLKTRVIAAPRGIDPRFLAWKGASVLTKVESTTEYWINKKDINYASPGKLALKVMFADQ